MLIIVDQFSSLLPPATKLGQGNIFRSVCQEFCPLGWGCLPHCMLRYTPPGDQRQTPPPRPEADSPLGPEADTSPGPEADKPPHPTAVDAGRYGQQAGDTHPAGMHSCFHWDLSIWHHIYICGGNFVGNFVNCKYQCMWHFLCMNTNTVSCMYHCQGAFTHNKIQPDFLL